MNPNQFNVLYLNFDKVFEIAMLLDNKIVTTQEQEQNEKTNTNIKARIKSMFPGIFDASAEGGHEFSKEAGLREVIEIKTTNALILRNLISAIQNSENDDRELLEGKLTILNDVELSLLNEEETRQMKLIKRGMLDQFKHEDISVGELIKTVGEDYSYLISTEYNEEKYLIKIPSKIENEFENGYTIDDLFIGNMTLIGIYKGEKDTRDLKSTFEFFTNYDESEEDEIQDSNQVTPEPNKSSHQTFKYLDLLAIVQNIHF